eukprot:Em0004g649a
MMYTALVTLLLDKQVSNIPSKFTNITNSLACIIRSFENLEYLRVLTAVTAIVGTHLIEPYLSLTTFSTTTCQSLVLAFPTLFNDLHCTTVFSMQSCAELHTNHMQMSIIEVSICRHQISKD